MEKISVKLNRIMSSIKIITFTFFFCLFQFGYGQAQLDFVSNIDYQELHDAELNDVWGYVDEVGNEYAVIGTTKGTSIVDVTDPVNPQEIFWLDGAQSIWRDPKVFGDYAYVTTEEEVGMTIIDLSPLPASASLSSTVFMGEGSITWESAHNCFIDESGFLYVFGANYGEGGAIIYDVNTTPMMPEEVGIFDTWYVHDGYARNDTLYLAHVNDGFFSIVDVSDKSNPILLGTQITSNSFTHNIWPSDDGQVVYTTDELPNSFVTSYDITDPTNIVELDRVQSSPGADVIPHNTFVVNDYLVTSYYVDGITIHDASYPYNLIEVAAYDTYPGQTPTYDGCWGVYPYLPSGNILGADMTEGFFVLSPNYEKAAYLEGVVTDFSNASSLNNVSIEIVSSDQYENTNTIGFYASGMAVAGTYDVKYSKVGYFPQTVSVSLVQGIVTTQDIQLVPIEQFNVTINVMDGGGNPITDAQISLNHPLISYNGITNGIGEENFSLFYQESYELIVGKWGYYTECINPVINISTGVINITLINGYYDDFSFDFGWTVTGNAETGEWERGIPNPTTNTVMGSDVFGDCGSMAYVTGNKINVDPDYDDVDNGITILTSPQMDLTQYANPAFRFSYAFFCNHGPELIDDTLSFMIGNGSEFEIFHQVLPPQGDPMVFEDYFLIIPQQTSITITNSMTLKVFISDLEPHVNITEAAFDFFRVEDAWGIEETNSNTFTIFPNPTTESAVIKGASLGSRYKIVSPNGILLKSGIIYSDSHSIELKNMSSGFYFVLIDGVQKKIIKQ
ncbi:MAG: choice-of-anchor B family protein, partial [Crocinitomicaceae bacterium]|nr:choice-of-anchor B family protein [Crocinitomicaceae bacterium]